MPIRLISLNIEGDNHYETIFPFFQKEQPDVICLQEVFAVDLPMLKERLKMNGVFVPLLNALQAFGNQRMSAKGEWGIAILSKYPLVNSETHYYEKKAGELPIYHGIDPNQLNRAVLVADLEKDAVIYRVMTTHFTWAPNGSVTDLQRHDLKALMLVLDKMDNFILCGDFNAPRGTEIFETLATRLQDNIPATIQTTMDNSLHRNHDLKPLVVDALFTTDQYSAHNVRVVDGVSDHCAIVADIRKK